MPGEISRKNCFEEELMKLNENAKVYTPNKTERCVNFSVVDKFGNLNYKGLHNLFTDQLEQICTFWTTNLQKTSS